MFKACRGCTDEPVGTAMTSVDIGDGTSLELVDNFCYVGDMQSIDGNADAAVEAVELYVRDGINLGNLCLSLPIRTSPFV